MKTLTNHDGVRFTSIATALFFLIVSTTSSLRAQRVINPNEPKPTLSELLDSEWASLMREYPEWATEVGYPGQNDRWNEISSDATGRRREDVNEFLAHLRWGNRTQYLDDASKIDYKTIQHWAVDQLTGFTFHDDLLPVSQQSGVQIEAVATLDQQPRKTTQDYFDIIARLKALPKHIDQTIAMMQQGITQKIVQPKIIMRDVPKQILDIIPSDPLSSPLLLPFRDLPTQMAIIDRETFNKQAQELYATQIVSAFRRLHDFIVQTYIPACRETIGLRDLPSGLQWYKWKTSHHTTTSLAPDQLFDLGNKEVERIRTEMDSVRQASGFKGDLSAYLHYLRTDPKFYYTDSASLVDGYKAIVAKATAGLPKLFGKLPSLTLVVKPVPLYSAPSATTAYYDPGSTLTGRPGVYYVNTYTLSARPKWAMQPLSLHEAVPGHHLQLSLADEISGMPQLRKYLMNTAYVEGWALYAESLGDELGFYTTPEDRMGELSYEMWRSVRLVVDVGIHWKHWTRQQAIDFFTKNSPKPAHDIEVEVDRYIADPGQALAYKVGQMKILEMRDYARRELEDKFDLRAFHDEVLSLGALPMDLFEHEIKAWVFSIRGPRDVVGTKATPPLPTTKKK